MADRSAHRCSLNTSNDGVKILDEVPEQTIDYRLNSEAGYGHIVGEHRCRHTLAQTGLIHDYQEAEHQCSGALLSSSS